jgi:hypothetical protein
VTSMEDRVMDRLHAIVNAEVHSVSRQLDVEAPRLVLVDQVNDFGGLLYLQEDASFETAFVLSYRFSSEHFAIRYGARAIDRAVGDHEQDGPIGWTVYYHDGYRIQIFLEAFRLRVRRYLEGTVDR